MPSNTDTTWFITGCSTGLGRALAEAARKTPRLKPVRGLARREVE
jgi:NAD(P)-dependent dehydrogenase (short-subunit alcohol dehydrogenase family)